MHTQARSAKGRREQAVRLLAEQGAIPVDQLARFLALKLREVRVLLAALERQGLVSAQQFLCGDERWVWLTPRGARESGLGFPSRKPAVIGLAHRRAVNEVRLWLARRRPGAGWVCERELRRSCEAGEPVPDAVVEVDGERHAIEVELSRKGISERRERLVEMSERYDAVVYFCGANAYRSIQRMKLEGDWPRLVVRRLPRRSK